MPRRGPRKPYKHRREFKLTAVRLSQVSGLQVQTVAAVLDIHPFMLAKWRTVMRSRSSTRSAPRTVSRGAAGALA